MRDFDCVFLSTLPARGATPQLLITVLCSAYFYPRSPRGERRQTEKGHFRPDYFYPRSPRGERPPPRSRCLKTSTISIHAPREGSDGRQVHRGPANQNFYPRSPRGERLGLSRLPSAGPPYFYPRSPRGERHRGYDNLGQAARFLSTLPARGATGARYQMLPIVKFLSTLPARGATRGGEVCFRRGVISIHAPREGSDGVMLIFASHRGTFLSTLPARGATGSTSICSGQQNNFYPRSPRGERRSPASRPCRASNFYPRSPRGERPF